MLLRHTTAEVMEREALTINPAKTCQPVGAMYASLGIHGCLPHSHGSQGCCSYHRSSLTRHYKEPVMATTSSFTEGSAVFGGQSNLLQALDTMFRVYDPKVIAVHTTCLSETIGDDIPQIVSKAYDDKLVPEGKYIFHINTPSYVGSHVTGYSNAVHNMVTRLGKKKGIPTKKLNVLPGWVEPSDFREIKRMLKELGAQSIVLPDTSDVLDAPLTGKHQFYPSGGTTIEEIETLGDSKRTIAMGSWCSEAAAKALDAQFKVPYDLIDVPIGLSATDDFVVAVSDATGNPVPKSIEDDRGRLVDMISDMHQYLYKRKVALFGDPDILIPLVRFLKEIGMDPKYVVSGTSGNTFAGRIQGIAPDAKVKNGAQADTFLLHQWIKQEKVDLLIGNTYGKYIARDEDIPLVRIGFPILDRVGHSYFPVVGYRGAMRILEKILSGIMDKIDRDAPEESFELTM